MRSTSAKTSAADTGFLVTNNTNVSYLTGFTGSSGYLLAGQSSEILMSDSRYSSQLESECKGLEIDIRDSSSTIIDSVIRIAKASNYKTIVYESDTLTKSQYDQLESRLTGLDLVGSSGIVEQLRSIKDESEIAAIRHSIEVNERAFEAIRAQLAPEQTELQVAHQLENEMRNLGAKGFAFDPIVGVGERSALPHGYPTEKRIAESPFVLIDWGAEVNQYRSDLTRVLVTSKIPSEYRAIYEVVLQAQVAAINSIRAGVSLKTVDAAARSVIESAGYGEQFGHGLGHSFGLEIHEKPFISPIHEGTLEAGMVVTVEPGIYLPGFGGARIEDDVLVTLDGNEVLSKIPKQIDECTVDLNG